MAKTLLDRLRGFGFAASGLALASCVHAAPPADTAQASLLCETDTVAISTGFVGAGQHGCALSVAGPVITVWPEASTAGPINPSPWYAFKADLRSDETVSLRLDYAAYEHRYHPWISRDNGESWRQLPEDAVSVGEEGHIATLTLPAGSGQLMVAGRPLLTPSDMTGWSEALAERHDMELQTYGRSLDGRALKALVAGSDDAERAVVTLTGQHPPEQSGVAAFKVFAETLMTEMPDEIRRDTRFIFLPLANPDGRARGHWRHNNGGLDLNRDWLAQTQPETREAVNFISQKVEGREVIAFMDFHSTRKTLVYTQPLDKDYANMAFPRALKRAFDAGIDPDPQWIAGHNAEAGTSKNWALQTLDVAGLTIELGDDAAETEIERVGRLTARTLLDFLSEAHASEQ